VNERGEIPYILSFDAVGREALATVGGKGANLGELCRAGFQVPPGFCVSTRAYVEFTAGVAALQPLLGALTDLAPEDTAGARRIGAEIRAALEAQPVPQAIASAIRAAVGQLGDGEPLAVRSSATAEDLPHASFAGQQDTYLNVLGDAALIDRVRACWASLFTDRAIVYRAQNQIDHRQVALAVVVQRMISADRSGILFTADPVTGHRQHTLVDAGLGLGEALVSGLVTADNYLVDRRDGAVLRAEVGDQRKAIVPLDGGGTEERALTESERHRRVLSDAELAALVEVGSRIEAHFGSPQDIEFCYQGDALYLVQARPITTLYPPLEPAADDGWLHVCFCVGHPQMNTDAMKPMGLSALRQVFPMGRGRDELVPCPWTRIAGSRMYIDLSQVLRLGIGRRAFAAFLSMVDVHTALALSEVVARPAFAPGPRASRRGLARFFLPKLLTVLAWLWLRDPRRAVTQVRALLDDSYRTWRQELAAQTSVAARLRRAHEITGGLLLYVVEVFPRVVPGIIAGRLADRLARRFAGASDEEVAALGRAFEGNVVTEMDLEVGDLADLASPHPALAQALRDGEDDRDRLAGIDGGAAFVAALDRFLEHYGMRGPGEFDLCRPRWRDDPSLLLRTVAGALGAEHPGAHRTRHRALADEAERVRDEIVARARHGILGGLRARLLDRLILVHRSLLALREHPKFQLMRMFALLRDVVLEAGQELVAAERMDAAEDAFFLKLDELRSAIEAGGAGVELRSLIATRQEIFARDQQRYPPRVLTSDNEIPQVQLSREGMPAGALGGTAASAGVVEGIAHIILDPGSETLQRGEVLVAPYTDPGWTPLFINAAALVTEVGGMMTHGSVVAREYGIPAVVAALGATKRIRTGQRVRVNGDAGWVEILEENA